MPFELHLRHGSSWEYFSEFQTLIELHASLSNLKLRGGIEGHRILTETRSKSGTTLRSVIEEEQYKNVAFAVRPETRKIFIQEIASLEQLLSYSGRRIIGELGRERLLTLGLTPSQLLSLPDVIRAERTPGGCVYIVITGLARIRDAEADREQARSTLDGIFSDLQTRHETLEGQSSDPQNKPKTADDANRATDALSYWHRLATGLRERPTRLERLAYLVSIGQTEPDRALLATVDAFLSDLLWEETWLDHEGPLFKPTPLDRAVFLAAVLTAEFDGDEASRIAPDWRRPLAMLSDPLARDRLPQTRITLVDTLIDFLTKVEPATATGSKGHDLTIICQTIRHLVRGVDLLGGYEMAFALVTTLGHEDNVGGIAALSSGLSYLNFLPLEAEHVFALLKPLTERHTRLPSTHGLVAAWKRFFDRDGPFGTILNPDDEPSAIFERWVRFYSALEEIPAETSLKGKLLSECEAHMVGYLSHLVDSGKPTASLDNFDAFVSLLTLIRERLRHADRSSVLDWTASALTVLTRSADSTTAQQTSGNAKHPDNLEVLERAEQVRQNTDRSFGR